jgi:hypothetical protein
VAVVVQHDGRGAAASLGSGRGWWSAAEGRVVRCSESAELGVGAVGERQRPSLEVEGGQGAVAATGRVWAAGEGRGDGERLI